MLGGTVITTCAICTSGCYILASLEQYSTLSLHVYTDDDSWHKLGQQQLPAVTLDGDAAGTVNPGCMYHTPAWY